MTIDLIRNLSNYSQWLGSFTIAVLVFSKLQFYSREIRIIGIVGAVSAFLQFLQTISRHFLGNHYLNAIGDCSVYIETVLLLVFYDQLFRTNKYLRATIFSAILVSSVIYVLVLSGNADYPWYAILSSARGLQMIIFSLILFFKIIIDLPEENLLVLPIFWINAAILFFFSCTFILSLTMDYIAQVLRNDFGIFWAFRNFLRAGFCVVVCIGIWKARMENRKLEIGK